MRVLLLNLSTDSLEAVQGALSGQGYELATRRGLSVDEILALSPEVLITEATPSDLSCCGLITQIKSQPETGPTMKVVMIVNGGALERARALDLGTDDVISFPFDRVEFAARIRTQFRGRKPEEEQDHLTTSSQKITSSSLWQAGRSERSTDRPDRRGQRWPRLG